jgi:hypothetical protein
MASAPDRNPRVEHTGSSHQLRPLSLQSHASNRSDSSRVFESCMRPCGLTFFPTLHWRILRCRSLAADSCKAPLLSGPHRSLSDSTNGPVTLARAKPHAPTVLTIDWKTSRPEAVQQFKELLDVHAEWFSSAPKAADSPLTTRRLTVCFSGSEAAKDAYDALIPDGGPIARFATASSPASMRPTSRHTSVGIQ